MLTNEPQLNFSVFHKVSNQPSQGDEKEEMKSFTDRVKRDQEKQDMYVFKVPKDIVPALRESIDLICMKNGKTTFIRARGNGHGNLHTHTKLQMQMLGKQCGAKVLYAKENGAGEIVFFRIYER